MECLVDTAAGRVRSEVVDKETSEAAAFVDTAFYFGTHFQLDSDDVVDSAGLLALQYQSECLVYLNSF